MEKVIALTIYKWTRCATFFIYKKASSNEHSEISPETVYIGEWEYE